MIDIILEFLMVFFITYGVCSLIDDIHENIKLKKKLVESNERLIEVYSEFNKLKEDKHNGNR